MYRRFSSQFLGMNSTVVYEGHYAHIVDPGVFPQETGRIIEFLNKQHITQWTVLLTHTHGDHISGWQLFGDYPVYGHRSIADKSDAVKENDIRYLQGIWRKQAVEGWERVEFPEKIQYLADGESMPIPPYEFTFYHTPGHSPDMSVIVIPEHHMIFSGDMLIQTPVPFVLHSVRQYWESLQRIEQLVSRFDLRCLIPGHGKPARCGKEINLRIKTEQRYLQKLIWEGIKLARAGVEEQRLMEELSQLSFPYSGVHAHRTNVQTFLRELDEWLQKDDLDLSI
ncbi:MAG: hypothetical protein Kow0042_25540 [Calditrichia bacterium]